MVGTGIKYFRKREGLTQKKLAHKVGTTQNHIAVIELNKVYPTIDLLKKIAKVLKVPVPVLFWFSIDFKDFKNSTVASIMVPKINDMILYLIKQ